MGFTSLNWPWRKTLGLIPLIILPIAMLIQLVWPNHSLVFNPPYAPLILQAVFVLGTNLLVTYVSIKGYLQSGSLNLVFLGSALLVNGIITTISLIPLGWSSNTIVTMANLGTLASVTLQLVGAITTFSVFQASEKINRKTTVSIALIGSLLIISLSIASALFGWLPVFLTSTGPTTIRLAILWTTIILAFSSSAIFVWRFFKAKSTSLYWYSLALMLFGLAYIAAALTLTLGDIMNWVSRLAIYLSGIYFLIAVLNPEPTKTDLSLTQRWTETFRANPQQSMAFFSNMLNAFVYGKVVTDELGKPSDWIYLDVNKAWESISGIKRADAIGKRVTAVFLEEAMDSTDWISKFGYVALTGEAVQYEGYRQSFKKWLNTSIYSPKKGYFVAIFEDITGRKKAEQELDQYRKNLEKLVDERTQQLKDAERLAAIGATAGMVGHDIRNPLQAITSDLYLVKTELSELPNSQQKSNSIESLDGIQANIDYINKIVQDLQDFARTLNPRMGEANLQVVVNNVLSSHRIPENLSVTVDIEKQAQLIVADPDFIKRIVDNLILNAIQAMPDGGKLTVKTVRDETGAVVLTVEDTGVGIPDDVKSKLFTPMFTTKSKGQGFGLAVVKRMTEALGGTVTFESENGKGTKFIIRLPPSPKK